MQRLPGLQSASSAHARTITDSLRGSRRRQFARHWTCQYICVYLPGHVGTCCCHTSQPIRCQCTQKLQVSNGFDTQSLTREVPFRHRSSVDNSSDTSSTYVEPISRPGLPFLKKRFTSSWARKNTDCDDEKAARGPLGLGLLHSSPEPLIDIIFVHGLRGGSIKTWRKGNDPRNFWPQLWLPLEPELHHANIHSFGYDSDWASTKSSILNVHDFGQSLLEEMRNSPYLRDNANVRLEMSILTRIA